LFVPTTPLNADKFLIKTWLFTMNFMVVVFNYFCKDTIFF